MRWPWQRKPKIPTSPAEMRAAAEQRGRENVTTCRAAAQAWVADIWPHEFYKQAILEGVPNVTCYVPRQIKPYIEDILREQGWRCLKSYGTGSGGSRTLVVQARSLDEGEE